MIQTVDSAIQRLNNRSQAAVVQSLYNAIHGMNHYPLDSAIGFFNTYSLGSGLSAGYSYQTFEQPLREIEVSTVF